MSRTPRITAKAKPHLPACHSVPTDATMTKHMTIDTPLIVAICLVPAFVQRTSAASPIRVVVWDEQQPQQRVAYSNFLGNEIAAYLKQQPGLEVSSKRLNDPNQGLGAEVLDACDVLVWWGHQR